MEKRSQAEEQISQCRDTIASAQNTGYEDLAAKLDVCRKEALGEHQLSVESADNRQTELREWLQAKIDSEEKKLKVLEERIIKNMQDYRREYVPETKDVDARLQSGPEFRAMLDRLEHDDLPRFESRLKALLNENTIREIANFQSQLNRERQVIRERIEKINQSLSEIEYNKGRYISLEAQESTDTEIREFRQSLRACTEGSLTGSEDDQYAEGKFLAVRDIIDRFQGREGLSDADRKWTRKVTDVRNGIVIFGRGYGFDFLRDASWLKNKRIWYWGDIDTHGFAILSLFREYFPHASSLLMNSDTLLKCHDSWSTETDQSAAMPAYLNDEEMQLFLDLKESVFGKSVRLEQELIPFDLVKAALADIKN